MKLLIIGGTQFVGKHLTDAALLRGHTVTLFNRGKTNPDTPSHERLDFIQGDRDGEISNLGDREWDAVIDTCGYVPRIVGLSAEYLKDRVKQYCFISTVSVYPNDYDPAKDEDSAELITLEDPTTEEITGETYGGLKVLCEDVVKTAYANALIVRPGLVIGPNDHTDRFPYWPRRAAQGGEMLAPEPKDAPVQLIDGRDLAHFTLRLLENEVAGIFNAAGPTYVLTFQEMVESCVQVCGNDTTVTWASEQFLLDNDVKIWVDLPFWVGSTMRTLSETNLTNSIKNGLVVRPLAESIRDTLAWEQDVGEKSEHLYGISAEREKELLDLWHSAQKG